MATKELNDVVGGQSYAKGERVHVISRDNTTQRFTVTKDGRQGWIKALATNHLGHRVSTIGWCATNDAIIAQ